MGFQTGPGTAPPTPASLVGTLAPNRLSVWKLVFFAMGGAAPLMVAAGVVTTGVAITGQTGFSLAFVVVALVLGVFSTGYTAMAGRLGTNGGGIYSLVARGWSKPAGVGAGLLALVSYTFLQVALYGVVGPAAAGPLAEQYLGIDAPWWVWALIALLLTALCGQLRIDVNGRLLAALMIAEIVVIAVYSVAFVTEPAAEGIQFTTLTWGNLFGAGGGLLCVLGFLGFVGFETPVVYAEESTDPGPTVGRATFVTIALVGGLYALVSWAMSVGVGPSRFVEASRRPPEQGGSAELLFSLANDRLGQFMATLGHFLLLTSVFAAMIAFHNITARYMFFLGREHVLPAALGRTSRTQAPNVASAVQSGIGLLAIAVFVAFGWKPLEQMFYLLGTLGGIGVLTLVLMASITMLRYFWGGDHGAGVFAARVSPLVSLAALSFILFTSLTHLDVLLGLQPGSPLIRIVQVGLAATIVLGWLWALFLRTYRPQDYLVIGLGAGSDSARASNAVISAGGQR